jgi:hypothetical protein
VTDFKPGDRVLVQGFITGSFDNKRVNMAGVNHSPLLSELPSESVTLLDPPDPSLYTEPRKGDKVEIEQAPISGTVNTRGDRTWIDDEKRCLRSRFHRLRCCCR